MKLGVLVESFDPARGGAERAVAALVDALARGGQQVTVYAPSDRAGPELSAPARRVAIDLPGHAFRPLALARALPRAARDDGAERLIACGKILGGDLLWPHGGLHQVARRASSLAGRGGWGPGAALLKRLRAREWSFDRVERACLDECQSGRARFVALSQRVSRDLASVRPGLPSVVLRNGVDPTRFQPPARAAREQAQAALRARVDAPAGEPLVLFCAHQFRLKGLDTAIRSLRELTPARLVVAGHGSPQAGRRLALRLGLAERVSFLGAVDDMASLYQGADGLLHPSRYDPCSLVLLEALASGLPVVASAADGASELIPTGAGAVVADAEDVAGFSEALARLLSEREAWAEAAATFDRPWSRVADELLTLLESA